MIDLPVDTSTTDPNGLLGRPGKYTQRTSWDHSRVDTSSIQYGDKGGASRGGVIEVWSTAAEATARGKFIQHILASSQLLGSEYDYTSGGMLVRITGLLTPTHAGQYKAALTKITGTTPTLVGA